MKRLQLTAFTFIIALTSLNFIESKGVCKSGQHWDTKKAKCVNDKKSKNNRTDETNKTDKAQQLVDAINNSDAELIMQLLSTSQKKYFLENMALVQAAIALVPDNSATVRCTQSNPDCGLVPAGKILKSLQAFLEGNNKIDKSFVTKLLHQYIDNNSQPLIGSNPATYAPQRFELEEKFAGNGLVGNYFKANKTATIHDPSGKNKKSYSFEQVVEQSSYNQDQKTPDGLQLIGSFMSSPKCAPNMMCTQVMKETNLYGKPTENLLTSSSAGIPDGQYFHVNEPRYGRPGKPNINNGFRAPDEGDMPMNKKMAINTIYSKIDEDLNVTFLDNNGKEISSERINAQDSLSTPANAVNIILSQNEKELYKGAISPKSYMIIKDKKGNITLQARQIYY